MSLVYQEWQTTWENGGGCHVPHHRQAAPEQAQPGELPCLAVAIACPMQPRGAATFLGMAMLLPAASLAAAVPAGPSVGRGMPA